MVAKCETRLVINDIKWYSIQYNGIQKEDIYGLLDKGFGKAYSITSAG